MLTNPSTLGLFDEGIEEVARIFHDAGALLYYDGANLNAVVGISRPGDMGFDIVHYNLHKTFSQPHGGGGPGGGPVAVRERIEPFLPVPRVVRDGDAFRLDDDHPKTMDACAASPGRSGSSSARTRTCARTTGAQGHVRDRRAQRELPPRAAERRLRPTVRPALPARVRSLREAPQARARNHGAGRREAAHGLRIHPPTIYFPLVVPEALMIEPTETSRRSGSTSSSTRCARSPGGCRVAELLREAPRGRPVRRLDEVRAAKHPVVRYLFDDNPALVGSE